MKFRSLYLKNYRNFKDLDITLNDQVNIFIGDNGQGKTNLLEALYFLTEGESFRYSKPSTLLMLNESQALIKSKVEYKNLENELSVLLTDKTKEYKLNQKKISLSSMTLPSSILFSPESLSIIKESSEGRRVLVDQVVTQNNKQGRKIITEFKKALRTRNRLLKQIAKEEIDQKQGLDILSGLNTIYLKLAAELTVLRINALNELRTFVEEALNKIHSEISIKYNHQYIISDKNYENADLNQVIEALQNRMLELQTAEIKTGVSLVGPQKHDVIFLYNGNDSRFFCSQGQQRTIILAFKMAQIVYHHRVNGFYPVLLLDDVLSELDLSKQESLISTLNQTETQTFVTTTDVSLISKLSMSNSRVYKIKNGLISF